MTIIKMNKKYLSKPTTTSITLQNGTAAGYETSAEVTPDTGYYFKIRYFRLITPPEVEANIIVETDAGQFTLLATNQDENLDEVYDASDWDDSKFFYIKKFYLTVKTKTTLTADRTVQLEYCGVQETPYL